MSVNTGKMHRLEVSRDGETTDLAPVCDFVFCSGAADPFHLARSDRRFRVVHFSTPSARQEWLDPCVERFARGVASLGVSLRDASKALQAFRDQFHVRWNPRTTYRPWGTKQAQRLARKRRSRGRA